MDIFEADKLIERYIQLIQHAKPELYAYHVMGAFKATLSMLFSDLQTIDEAINYFEREVSKYEKEANNG